MNIQDFIENLAEELDLENIENIRPDSKIIEIEGWSSLSFVNTIVFIDENFSKSVDIAEIRACETITDLYKLATES